MVRWEGVEPPTFWFVARCSIQLSYQRTAGGIIGRSMPILQRWLKNLLQGRFSRRLSADSGSCDDPAKAAIQEQNMPPLVSEGLNLALYGMGTVFVFLTLLVLATMLMSRLVASKEADTIVALPVDSASARKMAAITAAIHQHRNR